LHYKGNQGPKTEDEKMNEDSIFVEDKDKDGGRDSDLDIDSDEVDDSYYMMTPEQKKEYRAKREKLKQKKLEEYLKREEYERQVKETKLKDFKDRPEEVKIIRCVHAESYMVALEWDAPNDNHSPITKYHVY
jgi:hypothetical protein